MKRVGYLGVGSWGFCLASLLAAKKGYEVVCWTTNPSLATELTKTGLHPRLPAPVFKGKMRFTTEMKEAIEGADLIVESVTSTGLRPVFEQLHALNPPSCPIVLTSKGIDQESLKILPEVAVEVLGESYRHSIGLLSGPSFAQEVIQGLPASVVATGYSQKTIELICQAFAGPTFRIYPNTDVAGVALGGALKNIIAIACGISEGLDLGSSSKAALMTRGLHEIRKLAIACGARPETINGLAGMGDLFLTCSSPISRNYRFGWLIAKGNNAEEAHRQIGMVVEGAYTCIAALKLGTIHKVNLPITETISNIINQKLHPLEAVETLMKRTIKEEHL